MTGLTLSKQQLAYAQHELVQRELAANFELRLQDYRDAHEIYERVVWVEMLEALGRSIG